MEGPSPACEVGKFRGKIVPIQNGWNFNCNTDYCTPKRKQWGIHWNKLKMQNHYSVKKPFEKWQKVVEGLGTAMGHKNGRGKAFINFASAQTDWSHGFNENDWWKWKWLKNTFNHVRHCGTVGAIKCISNFVNKRLVTKLGQISKGRSGTPYVGIIVMDFPTQDEIALMINMNFAYRNNPGFCKNLIPSCDVHHQNGGCNKANPHHHAWRKDCAKTCGYCNDPRYNNPGGCKDLVPGCDTHYKNGGCNKANPHHHAWRKNCVKTCGYCSDPRYNPSAKGV